MNDVVIVSIVTGASATVPQVLLWLQNRRREDWERKRVERADEAAERADSERTEMATRAERRQAYASCLATIDNYLTLESGGSRSRMVQA